MQTITAGSSLVDNHFVPPAGDRFEDLTGPHLSKRSTRHSPRQFAPQIEWARLRRAERGDLMVRAAQIVRQRVDSIATMLTREEGKTLREAKG